MLLALCARGHIQCLQFLHNVACLNNINLDVVDENGDTPLHLAVLSKNVKLVEYVLKLESESPQFKKTKTLTSLK